MHWSSWAGIGYTALLHGIRLQQECVHVMKASLNWGPIRKYILA